MWASLCNFLYDKLFYKTEVKSRASRNDSSVDPFYGKRSKLSHPDCDTNGLLNPIRTPLRIPMQDKKNLTNTDDEEEECCVIAEIPKRKVAVPSSTASRTYTGVLRERSSTGGGPLTSSFPSQTLQSNDDSGDIEILKFENNSKKVPTTMKSFRIFQTHRTTMSQSKLVKSRTLYRIQIRKNVNAIQETYRLLEKFRYIQLLQTHTSCKLFSLPPIKRYLRKNNHATQVIPIIDLTEGNNSEGGITSKPSHSPQSTGTTDDDIQIIKEIPGFWSFQSVVNINPVNAEDEQNMFKKKCNNSPGTLNPTDLEDDEVALVDVVDDEDENKSKTYSESLEERLRKFMQITVPSKAKGKPLPALTPEQEEKVQEALKFGLSHEVLAEGFGIRITRHDVKTLSSPNWLNDEIINFYMHLIMERSEKNISSLPRVYASNTFFYPKLVSSGYNSLRRWTKQVDIFSFDMIIIPIHLQMHWCLSVIDFRCKSIKYYDSIGAPNNSCLDRLLSYLQAESLDKKKQHFPVSGWEKKHMDDIPQQMNGSDCGVFTCAFAEHLARDSGFFFTQKDMPYFRKKILVEILEGKLLT